jgi:hypothetical protein
MENNKEAKPVVVNKKTKVLYRYEGDNTFTNLQTKAQGTIPTEKASEIFLVPVELNIVLLEYPLVEDLITKLKMNIELVANQTIRQYKV